MPKLYTIGHSTHLLLEFIQLLHVYNISHLIDVRTIPKSRRVPWFNEAELSAAVNKQDINYTHMPELGGLRHATKNSINQGWINNSFRSYADYMQTPEFYQGLKKLNECIKNKRRVAIMCAEAVPWRCHRSMIADAEVIRGIKVLHIISKNKLYQHELTSFAVVDRNRRPIKLYYPQ